MNKANFTQVQVNQNIHPNDKMYGVMQAQGNEKGYFLSGRRNTEVIRNYLNKYRPSLIEDCKILDFGCGHGRMTRHMWDIFKPSKLFAADVLSDGVEFCEREFDAVPFIISYDNPISKLDEIVDIIIAVSVFTHLPRALFEANMTGLGKILSNDGLLIFTANGEHWRQQKSKTFGVDINLDEDGYFLLIFIRNRRKEILRPVTCRGMNMPQLVFPSILLRFY